MNLDNHTSAQVDAVTPQARTAKHVKIRPCARNSQTLLARCSFLVDPNPGTRDLIQELAQTTNPFPSLMRYDIQWYSIAYCNILSYTVLFGTIIYYTPLHYSLPYYTILGGAIQYCTIFDVPVRCYTILYYATPYSNIL